MSVWNKDTKNWYVCSQKYQGHDGRFTLHGGVGHETCKLARYIRTTGIYFYTSDAVLKTERVTTVLNIGFYTDFEMVSKSTLVVTVTCTPSAFVTWKDTRLESVAFKILNACTKIDNNRNDIDNYYRQTTPCVRFTTRHTIRLSRRRGDTK